MQLKRFPQVSQRLLLGLALAGNIYLPALATYQSPSFQTEAVNFCFTLITYRH